MMTAGGSEWNSMKGDQGFVHDIVLGIEVVLKDEDQVGGRVSTGGDTTMSVPTRYFITW